MLKYALLFFAAMGLLMTWEFIYRIDGGGRFLDQRTVVRSDSVLRKILLRKKNRDYRLTYYRVIPFLVCFVIFCAVLVIYLLYWFSLIVPIGISLTPFLENRAVIISSIAWCVILVIYIGVCNAL